jgi:hypothetical protein
MVSGRELLVWDGRLDDAVGREGEAGVVYGRLNQELPQ